MCDSQPSGWVDPTAWGSPLRSWGEGPAAGRAPSGPGPVTHLCLGTGLPPQRCPCLQGPLEWQRPSSSGRSCSALASSSRWPRSSTSSAPASCPSSATGQTRVRPCCRGAARGHSQGSRSSHVLVTCKVAVTSRSRSPASQLGGRGRWCGPPAAPVLVPTAPALQPAEAVSTPGGLPSPCAEPVSVVSRTFSPSEGRHDPPAVDLRWVGSSCSACWGPVCGVGCLQRPCSPLPRRPQFRPRPRPLPFVLSR